MSSPVLVEACVDSVASSLAAERGGAHRLELCDALFDGGTTPSSGMIASCKAAVTIPVVVMIRPRGGKGMFVLLRLYGPLEPWFDKTWRPAEIERIW